MRPSFLSYAIVFALAGAALLGAPHLAAGAEIARYVQANATISGVQIHAFDGNGLSALAVFGNFRLDAGSRQISGRNAVVWLKTETSGGVKRHDLTLYVEGDVKVTEPGGRRATANQLLLRIGIQGRVRTAERPIFKSMVNSALYQRANARRQAHQQAGPLRRHEAPVVVLRQSPPTTRPAEATTAPAGPATRPGEAATRPAWADANQPPADANAPAAAPTTQPSAWPQPEPEAPPEPVNFYAKNVSMQVVDNQRVIIAKGDVLLTQGNPDSTKFLEIRGQAAVIFTERVAEDTDARFPTAGQPGGMASNLPDPEGTGQQERIVGAYLTGDVVMAQGERYIRGPEAYYDFRTHRAIMPDPVFRTRQEQRNVPVYIRAEEMRALSAREMVFTDAVVTTSDFYTPTYHVGVKDVYMREDTPYGPEGMRIGPRRWYSELKHITYNIRGLPVAYWPYTVTDVTDTEIPLRQATIGYGRFGFGAETEWYLFRLLGLLPPEGYKGRLGLDWYERGVISDVDVEYERDTYSGYVRLSGMLDDEKNDDFGKDRKNIFAPTERGRALIRHKHELPRGWELQGELSYMCDKNFLEQFYPAEYDSGKRQETLLYLKKADELWAVTALAKRRINNFLSQTESAPDLAAYLPGLPLGGGLVNVYSEAHAGWKRFRPTEVRRRNRPVWLMDGPGSDTFFRADTRNEIDMPMHFGPVNLLPFAMGRLTHWQDTIDDGTTCRALGQVGIRANMHLWRIYQDAQSRLWDVNGLKHVVTPEAQGFLTGMNGVHPEDLYPLDPDIEQHIHRTQGWSLGLHQRLMTRRGVGDEAHTVEWMRFSVVGGFYESSEDDLTADGKYFFYRPEYSLPRNHVNLEYAWRISEGTTFLFDTNYDWDSEEFKVLNAALFVRRNPRLNYYIGFRRVAPAEQAQVTVGGRYQLTRKYSISGFERYDFDYESGRSLTSAVTITRKLPRWNVGVTVYYVDAREELGVTLSIWPEGIPEFSLRSSGLEQLMASDDN